MRRSISTGRPWETQAGYSRAVRVDNLIEVSATAAAFPDGTIIAPGDVYRQTKESLRIIGEALRELDASLEDVVKTRFLLAEALRWEEAGRAHAEVFGSIMPAMSMAWVLPFPFPGLTLEIEATAYVSEDKTAE